MRSIFFIICIIVNVYYFRKSKYLTDYQLYTILIFLAAALYTVGEYLRALVTSKGEMKDFSFNFIVFALFSPFFRLLSDPFIIVRSIARKEKSNIINLFQFRLYEIILLFLVSLLNLDMYRNELFQYLAYGAATYALVSFVFLVMTKTKLIELRVMGYSFIILVIQLFAFATVTYEYQGVWKPWEYLTQYYPFIIPEMKVNYFVQFILGIVFLSMFNFDSENKELSSEE